MPSTPHSILSPGESAATPAGVPVMMMSPAPISTCCESFQMISGTLQISSDRSPFCRSVPLTESQILPFAGWPIFAGADLDLLRELPDDFRHAPDQLGQITLLPLGAVDRKPDFALRGMADLRRRRSRPAARASR